MDPSKRASRRQREGRRRELHQVENGDQIDRGLRRRRRKNHLNREGSRSRRKCCLPSFLVSQWNQMNLKTPRIQKIQKNLVLDEVRRKYLMSLKIRKTPTILKTRTSRSRLEIHFHFHPLLSEETTNVYRPHSDEIVRAYAPKVNTEKGAINRYRRRERHHHTTRQQGQQK